MGKDHLFPDDMQKNKRHQIKAGFCKLGAKISSISILSLEKEIEKENT
jgi:hypothetical protein